MDEDDIYGSILSEPRSSNSTLNQHQPDINVAGRSNESYSDIQPNTNGSSQFYQLTPQPSLFLTNLTWWTNEDDIRAAFGEAGTRVEEIHFLEHKPNGKSKGMAIVSFPDVETATTAKDIIQGREIKGMVCEVNYSRSAPVRPYERVFHQRDQQYHHSNRGQYRPFFNQNQNRYQHQRPEPGQRVQYQHRTGQREDFPVDREVHRQATGSGQGHQSQNQSQRGRSQLNSQYPYRVNGDNLDEHCRRSRDRSRSPDRSTYPGSVNTSVSTSKHSSSSSSYYRSSRDEGRSDHRNHHHHH